MANFGKIKNMVVIMMFLGCSAKHQVTPKIINSTTDFTKDGYSKTKNETFGPIKDKL